MIGQAAGVEAGAVATTEAGAVPEVMITAIVAVVAQTGIPGKGQTVAHLAVIYLKQKHTSKIAVTQL